MVEQFGQAVLPDYAGAFTPQWDTLRAELKKSKNGVEYKVSYLTVACQGLKGQLIEIGPFYQSELDKLRILRIQGIKTFRAVWGMAKTEGARAPILYSGVTE